MKITPFFVALSLGLCISIPVSVYYFLRHNYDPKGMTAILALIVAFFFAVLLIAERLLVKWNVIPFTSLVKLEGIALAALAGAYLLAVLQG
jgi:hypothetical protein